MRFSPIIILASMAATQASADTGVFTAADMTKKVTWLRDRGGIVDYPYTFGEPEIACSSPTLYDNYLSAMRGSSTTFPTTSECWRPDAGTEVKATGSCRTLLGKPTSYSSGPYICEFSSGWFSSNFWMSVEDVTLSK